MPKQNRVKANNIDQINSIDSLIAYIKKNPPGFILALVVIVILAFLLVNYFSTSRIEQPDTNNQQSQKQDLTLPANHTILKDETLGTISEKYYGTKENWKIISDANKLTNPDIIHPGNQLIIPKLSTQETKTSIIQPSENPKPETTPKEESKSDVRQTYTIKKGDTLWAIAEKSYGSGFEWKRILNSNPNIGRLPNGNILIHADNTLIIPK